ncbi:sulfite exporter TauE/SafE family protein [Neobacillus citreus]|uniref:Probable membrane transporter protein n=1 Tax=Neobacillus citreus TaxID=2833578 RepID=A0A942T2N2_9BACI|nr:sulfite exporter TauE/SafE family protein [Neobacillus citreus]MCH6267973.1 sulfite exporter TauE/SafE family protein [Neobacillus citreus]
MPDINSYQWLLGSMAVMGAAGVQVLTGFGFPLVSIPLLLYIFPNYEAILISMMLSMFTLVLQAGKNWNMARWDLVWRLLAIGFPGLLLGVLASGKMSGVHLKGLVGITVLSYVLIQWVQAERNRKVAQIGGSSNESQPIGLRKWPKGLYFAGFASGILTGVVGLPGPPVIAILVPYLQKDSFRATIVNYFILMYAVALSLSLFVRQQKVTETVLTTVIVYMIPALLGYWIAQPIRKRINDTNFKRLVYGLLIIVGITSCWQSLSQINLPEIIVKQISLNVK